MARSRKSETTPGMLRAIRGAVHEQDPEQMERGFGLKGRYLLGGLPRTCKAPNYAKHCDVESALEPLGVLNLQNTLESKPSVRRT